MAVKLSARMMALADLVTPGARLADVGTDHGYLPVFLCQTGKIQKAIAMDINRGPLQRAEAHVKEYGLQEKIALRLSDGLHALAPGEADTVLIAGMGGALMKRILTGGEAVLAENPELVLQPQSEIPSVRAYLREIGYMIVDEDCVLEDGKFYFMMKARREEENAFFESGGNELQSVSGVHETENKKRKNSDAEKCFAQKEILEKTGTDSEFGNKLLEDAFGPVLLKKRHPVLRLFLERELAVVRNIREKLTGQLSRDGMSSSLNARQRILSADCPYGKAERNTDGEQHGLADSSAHVENGIPSKREKLKTRLREMEDRQCLLERALRLYES